MSVACSSWPKIHDRTEGAIRISQFYEGLEAPSLLKLIQLIASQPVDFISILSVGPLAGQVVSLYKIPSTVEEMLHMGSCKKG